MPWRGRGKLQLIPVIVNCGFLARECPCGPRPAFSPAGATGHFPSGPAAKKEYSFILLRTSADKRSGGVSGALRGGQGRETGLGARPVDSPLATRHLSLHFLCPGFAPVSRIPCPVPRFSSTCHCTSCALDLLPYPVSRVPYPGSPALVTALPEPWICSRIPYPVPRNPVLQPLVTALPEPWICSRIPYPESRTPVLQPLVTALPEPWICSRIPSPVTRFSSTCHCLRVPSGREPRGRGSGSRRAGPGGLGGEPRCRGSPVKRGEI
jgi:hypothetical protein